MSQLLSIDLNRMIRMDDMLPNEMKSQVILARLKGSQMPTVLFFLNGHWEKEDGNVPDIESWIYLTE